MNASSCHWVLLSSYFPRWLFYCAALSFWGQQGCPFVDLLPLGFLHLWTIPLGLEFHPHRVLDSPNTVAHFFFGVNQHFMQPLSPWQCRKGSALLKILLFVTIFGLDFWLNPIFLKRFSTVKDSCLPFCRLSGNVQCSPQPVLKDFRPCPHYKDPWNPINIF